MRRGKNKAGISSAADDKKLKVERIPEDLGSFERNLCEIY